MDPFGFIEIKQKWDLKERDSLEIYLVVNRPQLQKQTLRTYVNTYVKRKFSWKVVT